MLLSFALLGLLTSVSSSSAPLSCDQGGAEHFDTVVTMSQPSQSGALSIRVDGVASGEISHVGLNSIYRMTATYEIPVGTRYVKNTARIVKGTGTANARRGAKVWVDGRKVIVRLPARIPNHGSYTAPSIELAVRVTAAVGSRLEFRLLKYEVTANAVLVGDVVTTCEPTPNPYVLATASVAAPEAKAP